MQFFKQPARNSLQINLDPGHKSIQTSLIKAHIFFCCFDFSLYVAAGGSDDYAVEKGGVPYAFTFELGAEKYGFAVDETHLGGTVKEGYIALNAMILQALKM